MTDNDRRKVKTAITSLLLFCLVVIFPVVLSSCDNEVNESAPTLMPTITQTPCATDIPRTSYPEARSPIFLNVLVEGTESYSDYLGPTFDIVQNVLEARVEPGDKIMVSFMEYLDRANATVFSSDVQSVEAPQYSYSPLNIQSRPTNIPIPTGENTFSTFSKTPEAAATATQYSILLDQDINKGYCAQYEEETQNKEQFDDWSKERQVVIDAFMTDYVTTIEDLELRNLPTTTKTVQTLANSSEIFDLFCDTAEYKDCYLIIFSNLTAVVGNDPAVDRVDLRGVNVLVVLPRCAFLLDCSHTVDKWDAYLSNAGASSVVFIPTGDEAGFLISQIER